MCNNFFLTKTENFFRDLFFFFYHSYGYVDFADSESKDKAKEYHETEFMGRQLRVDDAPTRGSQPRDSGNQRSKPLSQKSDTVFVGNISFECDDNALREAFEGFGNVIGVRLPTDRETGNLKGYGYVQFDSEDAAETAVNEMNGFELLGRGLRTDFGGARPAGNEGGRGGFGGGRGGFGGRGGGRGGRGGFGGDRGGRGGFGGRGGGRGGRGGFGGNRGGFSSGPSGNHVKF
jgi:nucleolin